MGIVRKFASHLSRKSEENLCVLLQMRRGWAGDVINFSCFPCISGAVMARVGSYFNSRSTLVQCVVVVVANVREYVLVTVQYFRTAVAKVVHILAF